MLLLMESSTSSSPAGVTSTACGSIPILLPSNTVSTEYPLSYRTMDRPATAAAAADIKKTKPREGKLNGIKNRRWSRRHRPTRGRGDFTLVGSGRLERPQPLGQRRRRGGHQPARNPCHPSRISTRSKELNCDANRKPRKKEAHLRGRRTRRRRRRRRREAGARRPEAPADPPPFPPLLACSSPSPTGRERRTKK